MSIGRGGFSKFSTGYLHTNFIKGDCARSYSSQQLLVFLSPPDYAKGALHIKDVSGQGCVSNTLKPIFMINKVVSYNTYPSQNFNLSLYRKTLVPESSKVRCFIHTLVDKNNSNNKEEFINDLFKDRIAPVIPLDRKLIKGSCLNYKDKLSKAKFIKE